MIDIKLVLNNKEEVKKSISRKGYDVSKIDDLEGLAIEKKNCNAKLEELRNKRNIWKNDKQVSIDDKRHLREEISALEENCSELEKKIKEILLDIPNFPDADAPDGVSEKDNVVIEEGNEYYNCKVCNPLPHWEIG